MEIAISYQRLLEECQITQEKLSTRIGKNRSTITNYIRLLKLPPEVQLALRNNQISMGHARAIINLDDEYKQNKIVEEIINKGLSVRDVEQLVKDTNHVNPEEPKSSLPSLPEKHITARDKLKDNLDAKVDIKRNTKGKGSIVISFNSDEEFERIISILEK